MSEAVDNAKQEALGATRATGGLKPRKKSTATKKAKGSASSKPTKGRADGKKDAAGAKTIRKSKPKDLPAKKRRRTDTAEAEPKPKKPKAAEPKPKKPKAAETKPKKPKTAAKKVTAKPAKEKKALARKEPKPAGKKATRKTARRTKESKPEGPRSPRKSKKGELAELIGHILARQGAGKDDGLVQVLLERLTKGMGLSKTTSQAIVGYLLRKTQVAEPSRALPALAPGPAPNAGSPGASLDELVQAMSGDRHADRACILTSGLAQELSGETGLDPETAADGLASLLGALRQSAAMAVSGEPGLAGPAAVP